MLYVRNLSKSYRARRSGAFFRNVFASRHTSVAALNDVSFQVGRGETVGIIGESGSGKSTLASCVLQLTRATGGSVHFEGTDLSGLGYGALKDVWRRMQVVLQDPMASLNPRWAAETCLLEPLRIHDIGTSAERRKAVHEMSERVGINPRHLGRLPREFSGGQRQRLVIARALLLNPTLLVCDEPVSALDVSVQAQILNLLMDLRDEFKLSLLFIAHDLAVVRLMSDRVLVMHKGNVVEEGNAERVYSAPEHPYTRSLLAAVPCHDPRRSARNASHSSNR